jgi:hypothetical protein
VGGAAGTWVGDGPIGIGGITMPPPELPVVAVGVTVAVLVGVAVSVTVDVAAGR